MNKPKISDTVDFGWKKCCGCGSALHSYFRIIRLNEDCSYLGSQIKKEEAEDFILFGAEARVCTNLGKCQLAIDMSKVSTWVSAKDKASYEEKYIKERKNKDQKKIIDEQISKNILPRYASDDVQNPSD